MVQAQMANNPIGNTMANAQTTFVCCKDTQCLRIWLIETKTISKRRLSRRNKGKQYECKNNDNDDDNAHDSLYLYSTYHMPGTEKFIYNNYFTLKASI